MFFFIYTHFILIQLIKIFEEDKNLNFNMLKKKIDKKNNEGIKMRVEEYFSKVGDGIAFIIAFASILGLLGLIFGIVMVLGGYRSQGLKIIVVNYQNVNYQKRIRSFVKNVEL